MQQINTDIELLKSSLTSQAAASEKLLEFSGSVNQRLVAVENSITGAGGGVGSSMAIHQAVTAAVEGSLDGGSARKPMSAVGEETAARQWGPSPSAQKPPQRGRGWSTSEPLGVLPAQESDSAPGTVTETHGWSTVVKRGLKRTAAPESAASRAAKHPRKKAAITGTAVINNEKLSTVKTKLVSVFATRFTLDLDADTLRDFLQGTMNREVKCRKIETPHSRFSSFCVTAVWNEWKEMYDPQFWPAGSVIRQYFEPRRPRGVTGGETARIPAPVDVAVEVTVNSGETSCPDGDSTGS
ncbi:unnamed protein product [Merluccius merluccius]